MSAQAKGWPGLIEAYREHLPVTDATGRLVGILTLSNLARLAEQSKGREAISAESIKATLAAVSALRTPAPTAH